MAYSIFFFSSRRRHTRYWRDWSSDVCSSDLLAEEAVQMDVITQHLSRDGQPPVEGDGGIEQAVDGQAARLKVDPQIAGRSEERRVGKECRSRWSPYH